MSEYTDALHAALYHLAAAHEPLKRAGFGAMAQECEQWISRLRHQLEQVEPSPPPSETPPTWSGGW